ncbi:uracil-DNA glycosylase [Entomobacter blattae]|uniref:uracil-DNA glycosylase n=1 Tax=Entomobacter blattae TaxID=2762277 RepID=UPI0030843451
MSFREENKAKFPEWYNAPIQPWGDEKSTFLIVGLAPGLKGANRTGRPFTGDYAGELLYSTLIKFGFAKGHYLASPDDGLTLTNCRIVNAVRCVPPQNKPVMAEIRNCNPYLKEEINQFERLKVILALGTIAHQAVLLSQGKSIRNIPFRHGQHLALSSQLTLVNSYHVSRYNTSTGRLTTEMFTSVIKSILPLTY